MWLCTSVYINLVKGMRWNRTKCVMTHQLVKTAISKPPPTRTALSTFVSEGMCQFESYVYFMKSFTGIHLVSLITVRECSHAGANEGMQRKFGKDEKSGQHKLPKRHGLNGLLHDLRNGLS